MARPTRDIPPGSRIGAFSPSRVGRAWRCMTTVVPPDGPRFQVSRTGATAAEAQAALEAVIKAAVGSQRKWTFAELVDAWEEAQRGPHAAVGESTRRHYLDLWTRRIRDFKPELSRLPLHARDPQSITRQELFECVHSAGTEARHVVNALRAFWKHAVNRGVVMTDVTVGGFQLQTRKQEPKPIPVEMIEKIEEHLSSLPVRGRRTDPTLLLDVWRFMRATGARIGEALALKVQDVDFQTAQVRLAEQHFAKIESASGRTTDRVVPGGKTLASQRTIVVSQRTLADLEVRCTLMTEDPAAWRRREGSEFVFRTDQDKPVTPSSYRSRLSRELKTLSLGRTITPHDLRDTAATAICQALVEKHGVHAGLTEAARFLGHAGVTKALLSYVDRPATVVDQSAIVEDLDPRVRREKARRKTLDVLVRGFDYARVEQQGDMFTVRVLAEHLDDLRDAVEGLDFAVVVVELARDDIEF